MRKRSSPGMPGISAARAAGFGLLLALPVAATGAAPAEALCGKAVPGHCDEDAAAIALPVIDRLDTAWNALDGGAFARQFAPDAVVINIFGERYPGGEELAKRMQFIFDGIFAGSHHVERNLEVARRIGANAILVVTSSRIAVPAGPLSPETRNRQTLILERQGDRWLIRHWQNTTIGAPGPPREA